jgi:hypothetical protein
MNLVTMNLKNLVCKAPGSPRPAVGMDAIVFMVTKCCDVVEMRDTEGWGGLQPGWGCPEIPPALQSATTPTLPTQPPDHWCSPY